MSLRSKIILILGLVMASYVGADFLIQNLTVVKGFSVLEATAGQTDVERVNAAIRKEGVELHQSAQVWSSWDAMYEFAGGGGDAFVKESLDARRLRNAFIDLFYVCDNGGRVLFSHLTDPDTGERVKLRDFPSDRFHKSHPFLAAREAGDSPHGLYLTESRPMFVSVRPILRADGDGSPHGTLIVGRFFGAKLIEDLTKQTRVAFDLWQLDGRQELPDDVTSIRDELTTTLRPILRVQDADILHAYATLNDFRGRPDFLVRANITRRVFAAGSAAVLYALLSTLAASMTLLFVLMRLLQHVVLTPVSTLTAHAVNIGKTEDFRAKFGSKRQDEIGMLSREFDNMMEKLETARSALVDAARTAGKSEIATGILHNVGNVLNSANVSANVLAEKVKSMRVNDIETLSRILAENASRLGEFIERDPRGKHVQPALAALSQHMATQKGGILKEIESLGEAIERIRSLVKSQQSFAVKAVTEEPVDVREQIRKAISLTEKASGPDASLEFEYELDDIPDLLVDRHRLLEILVNIIQNARQAMDAHENHPKRLVLRTREYPKGRVRIEVTDSGVGIVKENLVKVFTLGFTTKPNGHGFGLHAAANAATEIDGSLTVHSDGPGKGATFVLEIPMRVAPVLVTAGARS